MLLTFRIPTILRPYTNGAREMTVECTGTTIRDALLALEKDCPGIRARVLDENGALRRFINIYIGEEDIRSVQGLATPTPDDALVSIIPAVAGGGAIRL
jgi:sulfur-carrier protein